MCCFLLFLAVTCNSSFHFTNGIVHAARRRSMIGDIVVFQCNPGYQITPQTSSILYCGVNGEWNGTSPECKGKSYTKRDELWFVECDFLIELLLYFSLQPVLFHCSLLPSPPSLTSLPPSPPSLPPSPPSLPHLPPSLPVNLGLTKPVSGLLRNDRWWWWWTPAR